MISIPCTALEKVAKWANLTGEGIDDVSPFLDAVAVAPIPGASAAPAAGAGIKALASSVDKATQSLIKHNACYKLISPADAFNNPGSVPEQNSAKGDGEWGQWNDPTPNAKTGPYGNGLFDYCPQGVADSGDGFGKSNDLVCKIRS